MFDPNKRISASPAFVREHAEGVIENGVVTKATPASMDSPVPDAYLAPETPGNPQGDPPVLPAITSVKFGPNDRLAGVIGGSWKQGSNLALTDENEPFAQGRSSALSIKDATTTTATLVHPLVLVEGHTYKVRVVHPITYGESPWFTFTYAPAGSSRASVGTTDKVVGTIPARDIPARDIPANTL